MTEKENNRAKRYLTRRRNPRKPKQQAAHDRKATEIPLNAKIAPWEVEDPYSLSGEAKQKIVVIRSIRNDPLAALHARRQIIEAQYLAGRKYQELSERAELGQIGSLDTTKEPVDGGGWPELVTDGQRKAIQELRSVNTKLGVLGLPLVQDILVHGLTLNQVAEKHGHNQSERIISGFGFMFRECLNTMAAHFGFMTPQVPPKLLTSRRFPDTRLASMESYALPSSKNKSYRPRAQERGAVSSGRDAVDVSGRGHFRNHKSRGNKAHGRA